MLGDRMEPAIAADNLTRRIDQMRYRSSDTHRVVPSTPVSIVQPVVDKKEYPTDRPIARTVIEAKKKIKQTFMESIDTSVISQTPSNKLAESLSVILAEVLKDENILLNTTEQRELVELFIDDMFGLGPLQPLLEDETVTDIMVNGPDEVYVERHGIIEKTSVCFADAEHISNIATRIASRVGRRVDESSPMVDARLHDGSRVNIVLPPLSFKSPTISIRKFSDKTISLNQMVEQGNMTNEMASFLMLSARSRLNILVSGGTGSGKTTLLNALSQYIDKSERIITIEDAAELRLEQPHVVTLEARPSNIEGNGKITIRDLLINSLRMRPDRIIVGEVRGGEVIDMLQAMNTGHDGSLGTIHANSARDALSRLENLFAISGVILPTVASRAQIASAIDVIIQIERMSDGKRRIVSINEVAGLEGETITTHEMFRYDYTRHVTTNAITGNYVFSGLGQKSKEKIRRTGLGDQLEQFKRSR